MTISRTVELNPVLAAAKTKMMPTGPNNELRARLAVLMAQKDEARQELVESSYGQEVADEYFRLSREEKKLYDEKILAKAKAAVEQRKAEEEAIRDAHKHEDLPESILATLGQRQDSPEFAFEGAKESSRKAERRSQRAAAKAKRDARRGAGRTPAQRPEPSFPPRPSSVTATATAIQTPTVRPSEPEVVRRQINTAPNRYQAGPPGQGGSVQAWRDPAVFGPSGTRSSTGPLAGARSLSQAGRLPAEQYLDAITDPNEIANRVAREVTEARPASRGPSGSRWDKYQWYTDSQGTGKMRYVARPQGPAANDPDLLQARRSANPNPAGAPQGAPPPLRPLTGAQSAVFNRITGSRLGQKVFGTPKAQRRLAAAVGGAGAAAAAWNHDVGKWVRAKSVEGLKRALEPPPPRHPLADAARRLRSPRGLAALGGTAAAGLLLGAAHGGGLREPDLFPKQSKVRRLLYDVPDLTTEDEEDDNLMTLGVDFRTRRPPFFEAAPAIGGAGAAGVATLLTKRLPSLARIPRSASIVAAALAGLGTGLEVRRHGPREEKIVSLLNGTTPREGMDALRVASDQMSPAAYQTLHGDYPLNLRFTSP